MALCPVAAAVAAAAGLPPRSYDYDGDYGGDGVDGGGGGGGGHAAGLLQPLLPLHCLVAHRLLCLCLACDAAVGGGVD